MGEWLAFQTYTCNRCKNERLKGLTYAQLRRRWIRFAETLHLHERRHYHGSSLQGSSKPALDYEGIVILAVLPSKDATDQFLVC